MTPPPDPPGSEPGGPPDPADAADPGGGQGPWSDDATRRRRIRVAVFVALAAFGVGILAGALLRDGDADGGDDPGEPPATTVADG